jgi:beta-galactosidase GanA
MSEMSELLERFRRGAELVASSMTGAAGQEVDFVPEPGKWSVRQIVCHLADSEVVVAMRFRQVIAEENPTIQWYDEKAWAEKLDYARRKPSHAIETFRRARADNYELLKDLPEDAFARTGLHSRNGPLTLRDLVRTYAEHAENHVAQLREVRAAYKAVRAKGA